MNEWKREYVTGSGCADDFCSSHHSSAVQGWVNGFTAVLFFFSLKHQECKQLFEATNAKQTALHLFWLIAEQWQEAGRRGGLLWKKKKKSKSYVNSARWQSGRDQSPGWSGLMIDNWKMYFSLPSVLSILCLLLEPFISLNTLCRHVTKLLWGVSVSRSWLKNSLLFDQMAISQQEDVRGQSRLLQCVRSTQCIPSDQIRRKETGSALGIPRTPCTRALWRGRVLGPRRAVAVAVRGAHQCLEERKEAGAGQVPGSRITWRSHGKENVTLLDGSCYKIPVGHTGTIVPATNREWVWMK